MKTRLLFLMSVIILLGVLTMSAQDKKSKETSVTGEVIDVKCMLTGMMGGHGEDHKQCAIDCIKGGLPIGILEDKTEKIFTTVPKKGMGGAANDSLLMSLISEKVKLTGAFAEKGGTRLFIYTNVEATK